MNHQLVHKYYRSRMCMVQRDVRMNESLSSVLVSLISNRRRRSSFRETGPSLLHRQHPNRLVASFSAAQDRVLPHLLVSDYGHGPVIEVSDQKGHCSYSEDCYLQELAVHSTSSKTRQRSFALRTDSKAGSCSDLAELGPQLQCPCERTNEGSV